MSKPAACMDGGVEMRDRDLDEAVDGLLDGIAACLTTEPPDVTSVELTLTELADSLGAHGDWDWRDDRPTPVLRYAPPPTPLRCDGGRLLLLRPAADQQASVCRGRV